VTPARGL